MRIRASWWAATWLWIALSTASVWANEAPIIRLVERYGAHLITIDGLPAEVVSHLESTAPQREGWSDLLAVHAVIDGEIIGDETGILGRLSVEGDTVLFHPRNPVSTRISFRVRLALDRIDPELEPLEAFVRLKTLESPPTRVNEIYPTAEVLPANLLKFYIHFSGPMSRGDGYAHIRLEREDGTVVTDPFPEIGVELWDVRQERFTLLFDPGRIKRGLEINESMGLPLVPGQNYRLHIDREWPDAAGQGLDEGFIKEFRVVAPDRESPDPHSWTVSAPRAGTSKPLEVRLPEALDAALMRQMIWLTDAAGDDIAGRVSLEESETQWLFTPNSAWVAGAYLLLVQPRLEDLAGNQIRRQFEEPPSATGASVRDAEIALPVTIR